MDPVVFTWKDVANVSYIVSSDMPVGTRGKRMAPGDTLTLAEGLTVTAFDSTDLGVSFLVDWNGFRFFHAGDLNFWHWREESTTQDIEEAEKEFRKAMEPLTKERIDLAFFPVDPRQGSMYDAGANYFIMAVKPTLFIPMHYFHRADVAMEFARTAGNRLTEVVAMPGYGDVIRLEITDDGYFDLSFTVRNVPDGMYDDGTYVNQEETEEKADEDQDQSLEETYENDPFADTDLPLSMLMKETSTCNGVFDKRRKSWVSVVDFVGIRFATAIFSGRMSCVVARPSVITNMFSLSSTFFAGKSLWIFIGIAEL